MALKNDDPPPPGYRPLSLCDHHTGRTNGSEGLLVPQPLAAELNSWRAVLTSESTPEDFAKAATALPRRLLDPVTRRKVLVAIGTASAAAEARAWAEKEQAADGKTADDDADDDEDRNPFTALKCAPLAKLKAMEAAAQATPAPAQRPPRHEHGEACEFGTYVHVFDDDSWDAWSVRFDRLQNGALMKTSEEGKRISAMKALHDRGPARLVMLIPNWQDKLQALEREMPNFGHVIAAVARQCALATEAASPLQIQPLLLAGGPGVGKSHFAMRLAKALELPHFTYNLESAESNSIMLGSEKHWSSSEPGELYRLIVESDLANPLILLDELDKAPAGPHGHYRPRDSLIPLLERSTSRSLRDKSANVCFNGSWAIYLATANALSPIEPPMLSRFEIHLVRDLKPTEAVGVVRAMHDSIRSELGLQEGFGRVPQDLVQELAPLANPRLIGRLLRRAFARAVEARGTDDNALRLADLVGGQAARLH